MILAHAEQPALLGIVTCVIVPLLVLGDRMLVTIFLVQVNSNCL